MGVFDAIRGRNDNGRITRILAGDGKDAPATTSAAAPNDDEQPATTSTPSHELTGIEEDEKHNFQDPDKVTTDVGLGQQKAEAAALVWSKPAVFGIYAW